MSSALTGNKIKDSYQAILKMGTNGSLDPIAPIAISDGLGNDTPLLLSGIEFKTQILSANNLYGLSLDLSSNSHVYLGDYSNQYNGTSFYVSDFNQLIQTYGLGGQSIGLNLSFASNAFQLGDFANATNGTYININNAAPAISTYTSNSENGLKFDFTNKLYKFGDFDTSNNGTSIIIDDDNEGVTINANVDLAFVGPGLENTGAGSSSGKFLRILLNGNEYKIDLLDP